jgi:hypothetical protein
VTLACCRIRIVRGHRELPRDCGIRLDQSKAEKARVEVDIGSGVDGDCRHVVKAANGFSHGVHLACTTLANVRGSLLSLFDEGQQIGVDVVVRFGKRLDAEVFLEFGGICNFGGVVEALASLIPCLRHRSAVFIPASCSFRMAMIWLPYASCASSSGPFSGPDSSSPWISSRGATSGPTLRDEMNPRALHRFHCPFQDGLEECLPRY